MYQHESDGPIHEYPGAGEFYFISSARVDVYKLTWAVQHFSYFIIGLQSPESLIYFIFKRRTTINHNCYKKTKNFDEKLKTPGFVIKTEMTYQNLGIKTVIKEGQLKNQFTEKGSLFITYAIILSWMILFDPLSTHGYHRILTAYLHEIAAMYG